MIPATKLAIAKAIITCLLLAGVPSADKSRVELSPGARFPSEGATEVPRVGRDEAEARCRFDFLAIE